MRRNVGVIHRAPVCSVRIRRRQQRAKAEKTQVLLQSR